MLIWLKISATPFLLQVFRYICNGKHVLEKVSHKVAKFQIWLLKNNLLENFHNSYLQNMTPRLQKSKELMQCPVSERCSQLEFSGFYSDKIFHSDVAKTQIDTID